MRVGGLRHSRRTGETVNRLILLCRFYGLQGLLETFRHFLVECIGFLLRDHALRDEPYPDTYFDFPITHALLDI